MRAHPERVELFDSGLYKLGVVGENTRLKVSAQATLHADASARQVRGADVGCFQVKNHHLEMHPRTHDALEVGRQNLEAVEVLAEIRARLLRVNEPNANATLQECGQLPEQGHRFAILLHVDILDVGSTDPQRLANLRNPRDDLGVMFLVLDVLGECGHGSKDNLALVFCHALFVYLISIAVNPADSAFVPGG